MTTPAFEIHPAAESFRLMTDDEFASLVADIKANGLIDALVLARVNGSDPVLVDGRNRLKACAAAGIAPNFVTIDLADDDAVRAFIRSRGERRDLSKGERAMSLALLYPEPEKLRRKGKGSLSESERQSITAARLSQARSVLAFSRELALKVRDGVVKLDEALATIKEAREAMESKESKLARLRADAPDLAELVNEDRLPLTEAIAALDKRQADAQAEEESKRETLLRLSEATYRGMLSWASDGFADQVRARIDDEKFRRAFAERVRADPGEFDNLQRGGKVFVAMLKSVGGST